MRIRDVPRNATVSSNSTLRRTFLHFSLYSQLTIVSSAIIIALIISVSILNKRFNFLARLCQLSTLLCSLDTDFSEDVHQCPSLTGSAPLW